MDLYEILYRNVREGRVFGVFMDLTAVGMGMVDIRHGSDG